MTNQERWRFFESGELQRVTAIELLDWAGYWTIAGLDEITDETQKQQSREAIHMILNSLSQVTKIVASMVISDDAIRNAEAGTITEAMIRPVIVSIMANRLEWVTGMQPESVS